MFHRVADFHRAFGQLVAESPTLPESPIRALRIRLLQEEVQEFHTAYTAADHIEMADALADICYIVAGTVVSYGLGPRNATIFESPYDQFLPKPQRHNDSIPQLLLDCFTDYEMAERSDGLTRIDLSLMNMMTSTFGVAWRLNIPINTVFAEVHRSNMDKLMPDGSVLLREDGKVQKPPHWTPPNIQEVITAFFESKYQHV